MDTQNTISDLNMLIEINNDRILGYSIASIEADEKDLKEMFSEFSHTSRVCKSELANEVQRLGGRPSEQTKTNGKIFRVWNSIEDALISKDRKLIIDNCEYAEYINLDIYNNAILNDIADLTLEQQSMLNTQLLLLTADHNKVISLQKIAA